MKRTVSLIIASFFLCPLSVVAEHNHEHKEEHEHVEAEPNLTLDNAALNRFGLTLRKAGPASIVEGIQVAGRLVPVDSKLAHVSPRFPGVVREVTAKVGDEVKPGTPLAIIQNNQNLQSFTLSSSIPGMVIKRHATLGEAVTEESVLFVVADLSEVWVELAVYKQDVDKVRLGQKARLSVASHLTPQEGEVIFFSPITEERTQSRVARISLKNPDPHFSPGAFVSGTIITSETQVPLAIESDALQQIEGNDTVFVFHDGTLKPHPVTIGRTDGSVAEVLKGLDPGQIYATGKTFLLKAELGKSEAEHEH